MTIINELNLAKLYDIDDVQWLEETIKLIQDKNYINISRLFRGRHFHFFNLSSR